MKDTIIATQTTLNLTDRQTNLIRAGLNVLGAHYSKLLKNTKLSEQARAEAELTLKEIGDLYSSIPICVSGTFK